MSSEELQNLLSGRADFPVELPSLAGLVRVSIFEQSGSEKVLVHRCAGGWA
jgi:hypothetical protein